MTTTKLKPRIHEQFLCGNCMWQFLFARVDSSAFGCKPPVKGHVSLTAIRYLYCLNKIFGCWLSLSYSHLDVWSQQDKLSSLIAMERQSTQITYHRTTSFRLGDPLKLRWVSRYVATALSAFGSSSTGGFFEAKCKKKPANKVASYFSTHRSLILNWIICDSNAW